jgi:hypothetical protein
MIDTAPPPCDHVWTHYVERLVSSRTPAQEKRTDDPTKIPIAAYFRTKQCETCGTKIRTNYKVGGITVAEGTEVRDFSP